MGIRYFFNSIYLNKKCIVYPIAQLVTLSCLAVYVMYNRNDDLVLQIAESILTFLYFLELLIKIIIQQENFLQNNNNMADVVIFTLIVSLMIFQKTVNLSQDDDLFSILLLLLRYTVQCARLLMNIQINRETITFIKNNDITFTNEVQPQTEC